MYMHRSAQSLAWSGCPVSASWHYFSLETKTQRMRGDEQGGTFSLTVSFTGEGTEPGAMLSLLADAPAWASCPPPATSFLCQVAAKSGLFPQHSWKSGSSLAGHLGRGTVACLCICQGARDRRFSLKQVKKKIKRR